MKQQRQSGIALVTVILVTAVLAILISTFSLFVISDLRNTRSSVVLTEVTQAADAISERARAQVVALSELESLGLTNKNFLTQLKAVLDNSITADTPQEIIDLTDASLHEVKVGDIKGRWVVRDANPQDLWVEIHATAETERGLQTVVRRIAFENQDIFELAMLARDIDCMFCHLQVNGDVGTLGHLRPGWGSEIIDPALEADPACWDSSKIDRCDKGWGSGGSEGGSRVNGNLYSAGTITNDDTNIKDANSKINGAVFTDEVFANYSGSKLPEDVDNNGDIDWPAITREDAKNKADGTISGGLSRVVVPQGSSFTSLSGSATVSGTVEGNLILIGSEDDTNPVVLSGNVYVTGDVIIKGYVTGTGAIYAGRNIYMPGNVTAKNQPDKIGEGECKSISDSSPTADDDCAKENVKAGKDTFRAAARGSIILGDYTEFDASGNLLPVDKRQSSDYYRAQFDFGTSDGDRYYDKVTGDELVEVGGVYKNIEAVEISSSQVVTVDAYNAYDYSMRPGYVDTSGSFKSWMSDSDYKNIVLGTQDYDYNSWRYQFKKGSSEVDSDYIARVKADLLAAQVDVSLIDDIANKMNNQEKDRTNFEIKDDGGNVISSGRYDVAGDRTLRILYDEVRTYETQVTNIDAFLYSNERIAGKTSMAGLAINGGMIGEEIGVLTPGRTKVYWLNDDTKYGFLSADKRTKNNCGLPNSSPLNNEDIDDCALTVNYDYRLKNGGFGFEFIEGRRGQTIAWRLAENSADHIR